MKHMSIAGGLIGLAGIALLGFVMGQGGSSTPNVLTPTTTTVDAAGDADVIFEVASRNHAGRMLSLELVNTGEVATNALTVQVQYMAAGEYRTWMSGTDFDTATTNLEFATTDLPAIPAAESEQIRVRAVGYSMRLVATTASGSTSVTVGGTADR